MRSVDRQIDAGELPRDLWPGGRISDSGGTSHVTTFPSLQVTLFLQPTKQLSSSPNSTIPLFQRHFFSHSISLAAGTPEGHYDNTAIQHVLHGRRQQPVVQGRCSVCYHNCLCRLLDRSEAASAEQQGRAVQLPQDHQAGSSRAVAPSAQDRLSSTTRGKSLLCCSSLNKQHQSDSSNSLLSPQEALPHASPILVTWTQRQRSTHTPHDPVTTRHTTVLRHAEKPTRFLPGITHRLLRTSSLACWKAKTA